MQSTFFSTYCVVQNLFCSNNFVLSKVFDNLMISGCGDCIHALLLFNQRCALFTLGQFSC